MRCRLCDTDLEGLEIEYHYSRNHLSEPTLEEYKAHYRISNQLLAEALDALKEARS